MKKILDSKFLFIVALSLIVLIVLGIGAFYLFDDSDAVFVKNGYVLNPLSAKSEKYFFDENTSYKENLSAMIEFKDTDNIDVTILKDSFLHYTDGGMSFLKNGALLNLDSINGNDAVEFYNITNKSIIDKTTNGYVIDSKNGVINLKNFIGRINDDKYIIAGALEAKIPGNTSNIKADYFEVVYTEEGIINIENKDNKFQVAAEGVIIYAGDVAIDLGAKKIVKRDKDIMSITAITIDGNENIEIIPKAISEETTDNSGDNVNQPSGNNNLPNVNNPSSNPSNPSTALPSGNGDGNGQGDNKENGDNTVVLEDIKIDMTEAAVGATGVRVGFNIENTTEEDNFNLRVTNLDTGRTVDIEDVSSNKPVDVGSLSPGTKYLFTLVNTSDGGKYYQKIIETKEFGITLEKSYATDSGLAYMVTVSEESDVSNATLTINKFNEKTKKLEPVVVTTTDNEGNEISHEKTIELKNLNGGAKGKHEILFDELDSNTIYTAILNGIVIGGANNGSTYEMAETNLTLKKKPNFSSLTATPGVDKTSFKLAIDGIEDPDNAIVSYTYYIYDELSESKDTVIAPIVKTDSSPIEIPFGNGANQLRNDTDDEMHKYYYRAVIKYFDNEKNIEFVTGDSVNFSVGTEPHITVVPRPSEIGYNTIAADIFLIDNSCSIQMPGRYGCDGDNQIFVRISREGSNGEKITHVSLNALDAEKGLKSSENGYVYDLTLSDLPSDTKFYIDVEVLDKNSGNTRFIPLTHTEESARYVSTASLSSFTVDWDLRNSQAESGPAHVIYLAPKLVGINNSGTLSIEKTAAAIKKLKFELYEGDDSAAVMDRLVEPIASATISKLDVDISDTFFANRGVITSDGTFGLTYNSEKSVLVDRNGKEFQLKENYTIAMYAYYDDDKQIILRDKVTPYSVSPALFNVVGDPEMKLVSTISKEDAGFTDDLITKNLSDSGITVGYNLLAQYDRPNLVASGMTPSRIHIFVYRADGVQVKFYTYENGVRSEHMEINEALTEGFSFPATIYMTYGNSYGDSDNYMRRGEKYYIGYYLDTETSTGPRKYSGSETAECNRQETRSFNNGIGCFTAALAPVKETPSVQIYPYTSTADSITYSYDIKDPDEAICKDSNGKYNFYYTVNDSTDANALLLHPVDGAYNMFKGNDLVLNLTKNNTYRLYYNKNIMNSGDISSDIAPHYVAESADGRLFEGYYAPSEYNFKYKVLNDSVAGGEDDTNNKVTIEILADDEVFKRIVSYRVKFSDGTYTVVKDKEIYKFDTCEDQTERCFSVPYGDFSNSTIKMKSIGNTRNYIYVTIEAFYDNGLTGFGIPVGNDQENKYMVFQNNTVGDNTGNYVTISTGGMPTTWVNTLKIPKGHYTYSFIDNNNDGVNDNILYRSALITNRSAYIPFGIGENGYVGDENKGIKTGTLNPKMVTKVDMDPEENKDKFWFNSITPKILVDDKIRMIDGAVIRMSLTGIVDTSDFCDGEVNTTCENDPNTQKYVYVEVWKNEIDAINEDFSKVARPTIPVEITGNNPRNILNARVNMLENDTKYYFRVYANLNKDGVNRRIKLPDDGNNDKSFISLSSGDLYNNLELDYQLPALTSDEHYADKKLHTKIYLEKYLGQAFDFNLGYAFCDVDDTTCGLVTDDNNGDTNIYQYNLSMDDLVTEFTRNDNKFVEHFVDISKGNANPLLDVDNFEFGKSYKVNVYAIFDYYVNKDQHVTKRLLLNNGKNVKLLGSLDMPSIVSSRYANYDSLNDTYYIDFGIGITDASRVLKDGHFYIKLVDSNNVPVGDLQVLEDGSYITKATNGEYTDYPLSVSALEANSIIRISGLPNSNTPYKVVISGTAFLNNANSELSIDDRDIPIEKSYDVYTSNSYGVSFGSISYAPTANSLVLYFIGGSNLKYDEAYNLINNNLKYRVCRVNGTIQRSRIISDNTGDDETLEVFPFEYNMPEFKYVTDGDSWRFEIGGSSGGTISFKEGPKYESKISFTVCDVASNEEVNPPFTFEKNELTYAKSQNTN